MINHPVFDKFGVTANLPEIYENVITEIVEEMIRIGQGKISHVQILEDNDIKTSIRNKLNYLYQVQCRITVESGKYFEGILCHIPRIVMGNTAEQRGYFIIEGIEKFPMIHEVIMKSYYQIRDDTCCVKLLRCRKQISVVFSDTQILFVSNEYRIPVINIISSLGYTFIDITLAMKRMNISASIISTSRTILLTGSNNMREEIPDRHDFFANLTNYEIMCTLLYMISLVVGRSIGCFENTDLSNYKCKTMRCYYDIVRDVFSRSLKQCKIVGNDPKKIFITMRKEMIDNLEKQIFQRFKTGVSDIFGRRYESVVMTISRRSRLDTLSSVRKVLVPTDENTKNFEMRMIHPSHRGYLCPAETPEGRRVGLIRTLAISCIISDITPHDEVEEMIRSWDVENETMCCYFINSIPRFVKCNTLLQRLIDLKLTIYPYFSISVQNDMYFIRTTRGRPMRCVYHKKEPDTETDKETDKKTDTEKNLCMIFLDPSENWYNNVSIKELHPSMMLGISASTIPLSQHNQCARTVFASSMVKQALEMYDNPPMYVDHKRSLYSQKPIVYTNTSNYLESYNGINMVVAISTFMGWNEEDAIVLKKSFGERIGYNSVYVKIYEAALQHDDVCISLSSSSGDRYHHGVIKIGSRMKNGDPFITYARNSVGNNYEILSLKYENEEETCRVVDIVRYNDERSSEIGIRFITERYRMMRVGDKLSSRHAQKGVIGYIAHDEDIPFFEKSGTIPDIVINPHAIPSRMTVGQLIESTLGKKCKYVDGTTFESNHDIDNSDQEWMIHPTTGELVQSPVSVGIVYYMVLPHQSIDKIHHRFYGEVNTLSNQPLSGRSRGGGLRVGEMEIDCLISHGASELVKTVIRESDMTKIYVCKTCGYLLSYSTECILCQKMTIEVEVPYAIKTIANVLQMAGIKMTIEA